MAASSSFRAVAVEAVQRLVEQPQRRVAGHDAGKPGPLCLAGRQQAHRDLGQLIEMKCGHRLGQPRPLPEGERAAERELAVERQSFVSQRGLRPFDPAGVGPQQPGDQPDQARLAASIGAGDVDRLPRAKVEFEPFEQQPPATDQCQPFAAAAARSCLLLERVHILVAEAEMMADLVDQYVADEMLERLALLGPFGEDRLAE